MILAGCSQPPGYGSSGTAAFYQPTSLTFGGLATEAPLGHNALKVF